MHPGSGTGAGADAAGIGLIADAVDELARQTRFPVAFGGLERDGAVHVTSIAGARTRYLDDLVVRAGRGLGGRALIERRPRLTMDYRTSTTITHDYDRMILGEGIATLFAVPVVVADRTRAMLYCGSWGHAPVAGGGAHSAVRVAARVADSLLARDRAATAVESLPATPALAASAREELRATYAELRGITGQIEDAALRDRLARIEHRLAALTIDAPPSPLPVALSPREVDVLAYAATGSTNGEIAGALGLKEVTVKSYLAAAMAKLDVSTRHAAVVRARRAGILP